ncbi:TetR family transcriptional regulator [Rhodococcus sp. NPDC047139]|uniref:TetR family transcriptional regulator n=1 Tax=Rhodococcus sp. NPDC047139 TaxID=3155141 RepID=UPI003400AF00
MSTASVPPPTTRAERKERTRQALLEAALELSSDRGLGAVSLREVARQAGIVPTAFYRHFSSMDELGVTLAADTMRVLRHLLREARRTPGPAGARQSIDVLVQQVRAHKAAFRFLARERHGGLPEVAAAISVELRLLTSELAADLGRAPGLEDWEFDDLEMAADLLVTAMLDFVLDLLAVERPGSEQEAEVVARGQKQMRLILLGAAAWRTRRTPHDQR